MVDAASAGVAVSLIQSKPGSAWPSGRARNVHGDAWAVGESSMVSNNGGRLPAGNTQPVVCEVLGDSW